ncbi:hypothetical protein VQ056_21515 [Paenibacillus sp. JTLBN-2024]
MLSLLILLVPLQNQASASEARVHIFFDGSELNVSKDAKVTNVNGRHHGSLSRDRGESRL